MKIDPQKLYRPVDPEMQILGKQQTLANWRSKGQGPAFIRAGGRILYHGTDLITWIETNRIQPDQTGTRGNNRYER